MAELQQRAVQEEETLSLATIARPYLVRLAAVLLLAAGAGAWLARRAGAQHWWTAAPIGLASAALTLALAWVVICPSYYPVFGPLVLFGLPWSLWRLTRLRSARSAAAALAVWAVASLPAIAMSGAWVGR
jgi:predicted small integral membrane protein